MEETLGKRIMHCRKRLQLTQDQLAEKLGVTAQAVSKWENDQSCPDISVLPVLADIFGISTDELLGRTYTGKTVPPEKKRSHVEVVMKTGRKPAVFLALYAILVGGLYLASGLFAWDLPFWHIVWTVFLILFGAFGIYPKFSFVQAGCLPVGVWFLLKPVVPALARVNGNIALAAVILILGIGLLIDGLKKEKKPSFSVTCTDEDGRKEQKKVSNRYETGENSFSYSASFGEKIQKAELQQLDRGRVSTTFGDFTLDLTGVQSLGENAVLEGDCAFGRLTVLVPRKFRIRQDGSSASFGNMKIEGTPEEVPEGELRTEISAAFGEVLIRYI